MSDKAYAVGDVCIYRHRDVEGSGRIIAMGADGVWVESLEPNPRDRRRCTVRHENIVPPEGRATNHDDPDRG